jgi:hypothetical protein
VRGEKGTAWRRRERGRERGRERERERSKRTEMKDEEELGSGGWA